MLCLSEGAQTLRANSNWLMKEGSFAVKKTVLFDEIGI